MGVMMPVLMWQVGRRRESGDTLWNFSWWDLVVSLHGPFTSPSLSLCLGLYMSLYVLAEQCTASL